MRTEHTSIDVQLVGRVLEITLAQPETLNRFTHALHNELTQALLSARGGSHARAVLLAAQGRHFSAGGDFEMIAQQRTRPEERQRMFADAKALFEAVVLCPLPIVAALQGDAIGLGATIALGSDAIVAARTSHIGDPHVVIGLAAGDGGCVLWPHAAGLLRAKRYLLSGDRVGAEEAYQMGLITDLVDDRESVVPAARALATRLAALPPLAVQRTKAALSNHFLKQTTELFEMALKAELDTFFSNDTGEALAALQARRPGEYQGN